MLDEVPGAFPPWLDSNAVRYIHWLLWLAIVPAFYALNRLVAAFLPVTIEFDTAAMQRWATLPPEVAPLHDASSSLLGSSVSASDGGAGAASTLPRHTPPRTARSRQSQTSTSGQTTQTSQIADDSDQARPPVQSYKENRTSVQDLVHVHSARTWHRRRLEQFVQIATSSALLLLVAPLAIVAFPLWVVLTLSRRRQYCHIRRPVVSESKMIDARNGLEFTLLTANLCLMPECIARVNNLRDTWIRTPAIAAAIVSSQKQTTPHQQQQEDSAHIAEEFPHLDFVCIQEAFDRQACHTLASSLSEVFPHVLFDAGAYGWSSNKLLLNSGLLFASRYEIIAAEFRRYTAATDVDVLASKGLLMVQVRLQPKIVGFVFSTHLQAVDRTPTHAVRQAQMSDIQSWCVEFRERLTLPNERVAFQVLAGDLNFDGLSHADAPDRQHPLLRDDYDDPCRTDSQIYPEPEHQGTNPASEKPWTVGTALLKQLLWHPFVATPGGLARALRSVSSHVPGESANPDRYYTENAVSSDGSTHRGRRRIDYVLFHRATSTSPDFTTRVDSLQFVTRLARLTDHVPIAVRFRCVPSSS
ncbi:hypothetical protein CAOG_07238 [Capsaspora owczarzaki ATCC 30864]|uniref:Uncharacterized protein n=1 Tax=Capsaspora owczarzaki (strain ATCC 30864) TaxID=595528 RepID=A0A0D2UQR6_CAPO3|nr:hypothetical protein CAOG_07238 [Capsaspora owczarzaki ATCC 30864]KJE97366.1 hypothetical protein CAOG_007238 [Capsaspora owczarzaki ATCC 30864]|eukprot:XP_004343097.1 hypothetical protein CAOG_07238 [Capsaspora owczarzaki ATCC 30864]